MKASPKGRVRPTILFSQTPHSVSRSAKLLSSRTAAELLRYLCELTIGFGRGSIELTYRALAEALHKDWRTIARAASLLRATGNVEVETLENGSYRWFVLLEPEDIVADPEGIYRVRTPRDMHQASDPHGKDATGPWLKCHGGHGKDAMGGMAKTPWGDEREEVLSEPLFIGNEAASGETENGSLKIDIKDTFTKIHHQSENDDASSFNHKKLLGELVAIGTGQRMARKLLRNHDHGLIATAIERVRHRNDLANRAGYLIREVEDGGYQETLKLVKPSMKVSRETSELSVTPQFTSIGVEQTKAELAALEVERAHRDWACRHHTEVLLERFQALDEDLKLELKVRWTRHLETVVPNTPKRARLLEDQTFHKIAFKEITAGFFDLIDEGLSTDSALAQLAV